SGGDIASGPSASKSKNREAEKQFQPRGADLPACHKLRQTGRSAPQESVLKLLLCPPERRVLVCECVALPGFVGRLLPHRLDRPARASREKVNPPQECRGGPVRETLKG